MPAARTFWDLLRQSGGAYEATIDGTSMLPTLAHGARVRIRPLPLEAYSEGQIVACALGDELFAHRIVHCEADAVVTRGDNRVLCDPPTGKTDIIGVVLEHQVGGSWVPCALAPLPRLPRVTAANERLVRACMLMHFDFARRVAGTVLHVGRYYRIATAALRSLTAPKS
jgi:hypothetical protein